MHSRGGSLTAAGLCSCRGWVLLGGAGVGVGVLGRVVMTSVRSVTGRCVGFSFTTVGVFGPDGSDVGSPTLQNGVVQRQAVTPVDRITP